MRGIITFTIIYYFNARYYDATIGRFINVDPVQDGSNWYVYCRNNPLSFKDPTGLWTPLSILEQTNDWGGSNLAFGVGMTDYYKGRAVVPPTVPQVAKSVVLEQLLKKREYELINLIGDKNKFLNTAFEKEYFQKFWYGDGYTYRLSDDVFSDAKKHLEAIDFRNNDKVKKLEPVEINGKKYDVYDASKTEWKNDKYNGSIGGIDKVYTDQDGSIVGIKDTYNFDKKKRESISATWGAEYVHDAGEYYGAKDYDLKAGITE